MKSNPFILFRRFTSAEAHAVDLLLGVHVLSIALAMLYEIGLSSRHQDTKYSVYWQCSEFVLVVTFCFYESIVGV